MNRFFGQTELYSQVLHFPTLVLEVGSLPPEPASSLLYHVASGRRNATLGPFVLTHALSHIAKR